VTSVPSQRRSLINDRAERSAMPGTDIIADTPVSLILLTVYMLPWMTLPVLTLIVDERPVSPTHGHATYVCEQYLGKWQETTRTVSF
jgi:hypothetical protein